MCSVQSLVDELKTRIPTLDTDQQFWLGIAGAPGSGKSTLAAKLTHSLGAMAVVIPMDGYHLHRSQLDQFENPSEAHARRGAPHTFDAERFVKDLKAAKLTGNGWFPSFDHGVGDPVSNSIELERRIHRLIIVEGNYLLLDQPPWNELNKHFFDESWFLDVPIDECKRRVLRRHIATGKTEADASGKVEHNDGLNAELVIAASLKNADKIIQLP